MEAISKRAVIRVEQKGSKGLKAEQGGGLQHPGGQGGAEVGAPRRRSAKTLWLTVFSLPMAGSPSPQPVHVINCSASVYRLVRSWLLMGNNIWSNWQLCEDKRWK